MNGKKPVLAKSRAKKTVRKTVRKSKKKPGAVHQKNGDVDGKTTEVRVEKSSSDGKCSNSDEQAQVNFKSNILVPESIEKKSASDILRLEQSLGIGEADVLYQQMLELNTANGSLKIDVSNVQRVDTAGIQLLTVFHRHFKKDEREIEWLGNSPVLTSSVALLGLANELDL